MLTHHLKSAMQTKIVNLADEARYIRRKELKWKAKARKARDRQKTNEENKSSWAFHYLRMHRISVVRPYARATLLAYGFLRGVPYHKIETPSEHSNYYCSKFTRSFGNKHSTFDIFWSEVAAIATRFQQAEFNNRRTEEQMYKDVCAWRLAPIPPKAEPEEKPEVIDV